MPRKIEWTQQLPSVIEQLNSLPCPTIDRAAVQRLFDVSPRQALRILERLGAYKAGKCLLLERQDLVLKLTALHKDESVQFEIRRRERVIDHLNRLRRDRSAQRVIIPQPHSPTPGMASLPPGIQLQKGRLEIEFHETEDLLSKLLALAQAIANDYELFVRRLAGE